MKKVCKKFIDCAKGKKSLWHDREMETYHSNIYDPLYTHKGKHKN